MKRLLSPPVIMIASLLTRFGFAMKADFGGDSMRLYEQALLLYEHHQISPVGAAVVYSGTMLPGALNQLLLGVPLFFSHGSLSGPAYWIAGLNFLSSLLTYQFYRKLFPQVHTGLLAAFILFAPWSILFTTAWNPSFLPLLGILFLIALRNLLQNQKTFISAAMIGFCIIACLQLHLSFVLLLLLLLISFGSRMIPSLSRKQILTLGGGGLLGSAFAGLSLIPYFFYIRAQSPSSVSGFDFFSKNVEFHLSQLLSYPAYFFRFLSFSSFEISRFILRGNGPEGLLLYMKNHGTLSILLVMLELFSIVMIGASLRFFVNQKTRQILQHLLKEKKLRSLTPEDRLYFLHWATPLVTGLLFVFSIKNPSAHTYWILMPMSFYPLINTWNDFSKKKFESWMAGLFIVLSLLSLKIYLSSDPPTTEDVQRQLQSPRPVAHHILSKSVS